MAIWKSKEPDLAGHIAQELTLARREIRTGRFQRTMALIAGGAALVSGFEAYIQHQRGAFAHPLMWTPVWLTPPTVVGALAAVVSRTAARRVLPVLALAALVDGLIGFGYHLRGIGRLPGGWKLGQYNIVMGPPIFAPLLTCMVGVIGLFATFLRREEVPPLPAHAVETLRHAVNTLDPPDSWLEAVEQAVAEGTFQRPLAVAAATFAALAGGEAYFEHLHGSFNSRLMWTPIWLTPPMVLAGIGAAISPQVARRVLPLASLAMLADGALGFGLHLQGIKRMPGGFANLRFNITMGPPLFAPLLFSAVGLLGLLAALLRRKESH